MSRPYYAVVLIATTFALPACRAETAEVGVDPVRSSSTQAPAVSEPNLAIEGEVPVAMETADPRGASDGESAAPATPAAPAAEEPARNPVREGTQAAPEELAVQQESNEPSEAEEILERVEEAYAGIRSMQADFVQHLSVPLLGTDRTSRGRIYQRKPDRFLMRFTDPAGDVIVADGEYFWMYYPSTDSTQVIRASMSEGGGQADLQQQFLRDANERYVATLAGEEAVDGRPAYVLTLVPRGESPYKLVRVWVDKEDYLVRRFEMTEENDSVRRLELSNLQRNIELPDSLFEFTPPPGAEVFEQ